MKIITYISLNNEETRCDAKIKKPENKGNKKLKWLENLLNSFGIKIQKRI